MLVHIRITPDWTFLWACEAGAFLRSGPVRVRIKLHKAFLETKTSYMYIIWALFPPVDHDQHFKGTLEDQSVTVRLVSL